MRTFYTIRHIRNNDLFLDAAGDAEDCPTLWDKLNEAELVRREDAQVAEDWQICEVRLLVNPIGAPLPANCETCGKPT